MQTIDTGRRAEALDRAIDYCVGLDEIKGTTTAPAEVLKVAEEFLTWLNAGEPAAAPGQVVSGGVAQTNA